MLYRVIDGSVKPMVCLLPFKANTAKQSHGAGRGAGRQTDGWPRHPPPPIPSSNQPDTKEAASDNTNSTMIGSDGSQSAAKSGGVIIDCFFCSLVLIERGRREGGVIGGRGEGKKISWGQEEVFKQNNRKKFFFLQNNLICFRRGRGNFHI